jgi:hypothetical protein
MVPTLDWVNRALIGDVRRVLILTPQLPTAAQLIGVAIFPTEELLAKNNPHPVLATHCHRGLKIIVGDMNLSQGLVPLLL